MILCPSIGTLHHSLCLLKENEASSLILCQAGIQIVVYLNDVLLVCTSRELISSRSVSSLAAFLHFRIVINLSKTTVTVSVEITVLYSL